MTIVVFFNVSGPCKPFHEISTYNITAKDYALRNAEIIRFCNHSLHTMELRIGMRSQYHLKTMVRIRNGSNTNPERIECPFYGDYIFSYKGDIKRILKVDVINYNNYVD